MVAQEKWPIAMCVVASMALVNAARPFDRQFPWPWLYRPWKLVSSEKVVHPTTAPNIILVPLTMKN